MKHIVAALTYVAIAAIIGFTIIESTRVISKHKDIEAIRCLNKIPKRKR